MDVLLKKTILQLSNFRKSIYAQVPAIVPYIESHVNNRIYFHIFT